jgi:hypothetical protein
VLRKHQSFYVKKALKSLNRGLKYKCCRAFNASLWLGFRKNFRCLFPYCTVLLYCHSEEGLLCILFCYFGSFGSPLPLFCYCFWLKQNLAQKKRHSFGLEAKYSGLFGLFCYKEIQNIYNVKQKGQKENEAKRKRNKVKLK